MTTLIDVFRWISSKTAGIPAPAADITSYEPAAALTLEDRQAACGALHGLEAEGEAMGIKLAREHDRAVEASMAADRAAEEARKAAGRAKALRDAHSWGLEVRKSKLRAELARGASPVIEQTIAELARHWEAARMAGRHIGAMRAPLTQAETDDNLRADANLAGLLTAQQECEALKYEALTENELAAALEAIIQRIPARYPQHEQIRMEVPKVNGSARPRASHNARAA